MLTFTLSSLLLLSTAQSTAAPVPTPDPAEVRLRTDWADLGRYREANARLGPVRGSPRVVFMGDSITEGWPDKRPGFFTLGRIGRGIGGQTTPQMLVRFRQDVVDLKPDVVHIMAGTNDIAGNTGPMTMADTQANIRSMVELAEASGIRVILASVPPADMFPWRPGLETGSRIRDINAWLRNYARERGATYADYWSAMRKPGTLGMKEGLSYDHVHPTEAGYAIMAPVAERAIRAALAAPSLPRRARP